MPRRMLKQQPPLRRRSSCQRWRRCGSARRRLSPPSPKPLAARRACYSGCGLNPIQLTSKCVGERRELLHGNYSDIQIEPCTTCCYTYCHATRLITTVRYTFFSYHSLACQREVDGILLRPKLALPFFLKHVWIAYYPDLMACTQTSNHLSLLLKITFSQKIVVWQTNKKKNSTFIYFLKDFSWFFSVLLFCFVFFCFVFFCFLEI